MKQQQTFSALKREQLAAGKDPRASRGIAHLNRHKVATQALPANGKGKGYATDSKAKKIAQWLASPEGVARVVAGVNKKRKDSTGNLSAFNRGYEMGLEWRKKKAAETSGPRVLAKFWGGDK